LKIYIPQGSVATQLRGGEMFNSRLIANCPICPWKNCENRLVFGEDMEMTKCDVFGDAVYIIYLTLDYIISLSLRCSSLYVIL